MAKNLSLNIILLMLFCFASTASAAGYVGASIGKTDYDVPPFDDPIGFEIMGGADISQNAAFEVSYVNFGESSDNIPPEWKLSATSLTFGALLKAPLSPTANAFVKVGMHMWDIELKEDGFGLLGEDDGTDIFFGFGASFNVDPRLSVGVRYMSYDFDGDDITQLLFNVMYGI